VVDEEELIFNSDFHLLMMQADSKEKKNLKIVFLLAKGKKQKSSKSDQASLYPS